MQLVYLHVSMFLYNFFFTIYDEKNSRNGKWNEIKINDFRIFTTFLVARGLLHYSIQSSISLGCSSRYQSLCQIEDEFVIWFSLKSFIINFRISRQKSI